MRRSLFGRIWPGATAVVLFLGFVFPVYWMFATAFKANKDIVGDTPVWFPTSPTTEHFRRAVEADGFWTFVANSLITTVVAVLLSLVIALLASFAIARMRFRGRRGFILVMMMAQMAPWEVMVIAYYMLVRDADMLNSLPPLIAIYTLCVLPFTVLTLRGYVAAVPKELEESAMVDGCTRPQAFRKVIFPLLAPGLMATSLFGFITTWKRVPLRPHPEQGPLGTDAAAVAHRVPHHVRRRLGRHDGRPPRSSPSRSSSSSSSSSAGPLEA
ncbi:carbohydrate ABC transporter permease [Streptomyces thioluteus]|uniref:Carbohydrate ABC transporter permease n=1 Tax=Streptomyces thioluteus TaxID=66431 RepID=A0ABP6JK46_STRTU